ncbi:hypothetical protein THIOSC15_3370003 [uncultured Thiomicrorhabdus sp.]
MTANIDMESVVFEQGVVGLNMHMLGL